VRPEAGFTTTHVHAADAALPFLQARCVGTKSQMRVLCSDARRHRFFEFDDVKNVYGG
jgi:hypothetical protein